MRPSEFAPHLNAGSMTLHAVTLGTRGECIASTSSSSSTSSGDDARRWSVRGSSTDTIGRARAPSGKPRATHGSARRRRSLLEESDRALEISRHPRTGSFRARCVSASSASDDRVDAAGRRGYDEYGRVPKEQFRADVIANFPKFILASAGLIASAVAIDLFRFSRLMRRGGAEARWNDLASGENSGKESLLGGEPTVIYDVCGRVVATLSSQSVRLRDVAAPAWQAIVATEDHRFFQHRGVDVNGLGRAVVSLGRLGGGSTITQQLIKNMVLSNDRTVTRKLAEILLSLELEKRLSKERTLEAYVNNVYWGHGAFGIAAASAAYFGKTPAQLDIGEASLLAALLPCPEALSPYANPVGALRARKQALARMARHGYLSDDEAKEWGDAPLPRTLELRKPTELQRSTGLEGIDDFADVYATHRRSLGRAGIRTGTGPFPADSLNRGKSAPYRAPFFVSEALSELADLLEGREDVLARGGLKVHTTLDLDLQEKAEQLVLEDGLTTIRGVDKGEAALVAVDPANGGVRVLIGSRDYGASAHNRAVRARRCVGSAFRPFVYLAALQSGAVTPSTLLIDEAHAFEVDDTPGDGSHDSRDESRDESHPAGRRTRTYTPPANGDGRGHRGVVNVRECLVDSLNVPTVKVAQMVGVDAVAATAKACGINSPMKPIGPGLSMSVGAPGSDVTPCELASAYATIAARGMYSAPHLISEVKDADGKLVYKRKGVTRAAAGKDATGKLGGLLRDALATNGFVTGVTGAPGVLAGVAGTSDGATDAWFAGYAPGLACVAWCGRDDGTELPGGGEALAAPLWGRFMRAAGARGATGERDGREGRRRRRRRRRTDKRRGEATV